MLLLSFTVRNHKSLRDEVTLDLTRPKLKTLQPPTGERWADYVFPLAGIYGANATGKSTIVDALLYAASAVESSATEWQAGPEMPRAPFRFDHASRETPSFYQLEFVHEGRRYEYEFEIGAPGVERERLRDLPGKRWRTLLERDTARQVLKYHKELKTTIGRVARRELVLSRALLLEDGLLGQLAAALRDGFQFCEPNSHSRRQWVKSTTAALVERRLEERELVAALRVADIGIAAVEIEREELPEQVRAILADLRRKGAENDARPLAEGEEITGADDPDSLPQVAYSLRFTHRGGQGDADARLDPGQESDGTIAWLSFIVPALQVLRHGGVLAVDEIDASLHPHLVEVSLQMFADPDINRSGAQLVFTSHDTYILSPLSDIELAPEQVWFTEKSGDGVTELYSLADFPRKQDANVARRYLLGRYGATPRLATSVLAELVHGTGARDG